MNESIYLDNCATTKPFDEVASMVADTMIELFYNPSSRFKDAVLVHQRMQAARKVIAQALEILPDQVIWTSGGTESNNLALLGIVNAYSARFGKKIITTGVEHPSVTEPLLYLRKLGFQVEYLDCDREGRLLPDQLESRVDERTVLVSIQQINNETGCIQDLSMCKEIIHKKNPNAFLHSDGVQGFLHTAASPKADLYSISAHKVHGPRGIGALAVRKGLRLAGVQMGGGQEQGYRSGTENIPGILGFAQAVQQLQVIPSLEAMRAMKCRLYTQLASQLEGVAVNGPAPDSQKAAGHILNISIEGIRAEVLLHTLDEQGVIIGIGSACSSHHKGHSSVLKAMGLPVSRMEGAVRFGLSVLTTAEHIDIAADKTVQAVRQLRKFRRK